MKEIDVLFSQYWKLHEHQNSLPSVKSYQGPPSPQYFRLKMKKNIRFSSSLFSPSMTMLYLLSRFPFEEVKMSIIFLIFWTVFVFLNSPFHLPIYHPLPSSGLKKTAYFLLWFELNWINKNVPVDDKAMKVCDRMSARRDCRWYLGEVLGSTPESFGDLCSRPAGRIIQWH